MVSLNAQEKKIKMTTLKFLQRHSFIYLFYDHRSRHIWIKVTERLILYVHEVVSGLS